MTSCRENNMFVCRFFAKNRFVKTSVMNDWRPVIAAWGWSHVMILLSLMVWPAQRVADLYRSHSITFLSSAVFCNHFLLSSSEWKLRLLTFDFMPTHASSWTFRQKSFMRNFLLLILNSVSVNNFPLVFEVPRRPLLAWRFSEAGKAEKNTNWE